MNELTQKIVSKGSNVSDFEAWLIGVDIDGSNAVLTFKTDGPDSRIIRVIDEYSPYFYVICFDHKDREMDSTEGSYIDYVTKAMQIIDQHPHVVDVNAEERYVSLDDKRPKTVIRVVVDSVMNFKKVVADMQKVPHVKETAETRLPHYFMYEMVKGLCFFRKYDVEVGSENRAEYVRETISVGRPELNYAAVRFREREVDVLFKEKLHKGIMPESLPAFAEFFGIDVLFSYGGDKHLACIKASGIVSTPTGCFMKTCMHIDVRRDMRADLYNETEKPGKDMLQEIMDAGAERMLSIIELSSMTGTGPEIVSRVSPGKLNTYLHMVAARQKGYVIPDTKKSMETPKSLHMLGLMDKSGLIFYPEPGVYRNVAKCDFASMYPNIIVHFNISPETMNCDCCADSDDPDRIDVPETGWHICGKKKGIIPVGIKGVLKRRLELKKIMKTQKNRETRKEYDIRQRAHKHVLVCAFGYMGYSNFIFSNVVCKECIMLFGRHILLRTKQIAEEFGLEVVYGITDSVFVINGDDETYKRFADAVSREIGIELEIDCMFDAIAFPESVDGTGIANKYYGIKRELCLNQKQDSNLKQHICHENGIEARGIVLRHRDCPEMLAEFQEKAARLLLNGIGSGKAASLEDNILKAEMLKQAYKTMLMNSRFPVDALSITKKLRRPVGMYAANAPHVVAYKHLIGLGDENDDRKKYHDSHASESTSNRCSTTTSHTAGRGPTAGSNTVTYVWVRQGPRPVQYVKEADIDVAKYSELLDAALEEMIRGLEGTDRLHRLNKAVKPVKG